MERRTPASSKTAKRKDDNFHLSRFRKSVLLHTDTSDIGVGEVLFQKEETTERELSPIVIESYHPESKRYYIGKRN